MGHAKKLGHAFFNRPRQFRITNYLVARIGFDTAEIQPLQIGSNLRESVKSAEKSEYNTISNLSTKV